MDGFGHGPGIHRFLYPVLNPARPSVISTSRRFPAALTAAPSPLDMLKAKFVNGEITAEEYEAKKKILEG